MTLQIRIELIIIQFIIKLVLFILLILQVNATKL